MYLLSAAVWSLWKLHVTEKSKFSDFYLRVYIVTMAYFNLNAVNLIDLEGLVPLEGSVNAFCFISVVFSSHQKFGAK